jgi:hypothetical protein
MMMKKEGRREMKEKRKTEEILSKQICFERCDQCVNTFWTTWPV